MKKKALPRGGKQHGRNLWKTRKTFIGTFISAASFPQNNSPAARCSIQDLGGTNFIKAASFIN